MQTLREQKKLSRKYENLKKKGGTATKSNVIKMFMFDYILSSRINY